MDKSFVSFLGKDESFKVYVLTTLCYYIYSNSGMEEKKLVTHPGGWRTKKSCWIIREPLAVWNLFFQNRSVTIAGITEEIQTARNFPHSHHKIIWSRFAFLHHQWGNSMAFTQSKDAKSHLSLNNDNFFICSYFILLKENYCQLLIILTDKCTFKELKLKFSLLESFVRAVQSLVLQVSLSSCLNVTIYSKRRGHME